MLASSGRQRRWPAAVSVVFLLALLITQLALVAHRESITWDEDDHIYAGYISLKTGDHGINPEHPPLVKMIAAVPILSMTLNLPAMQDRYFKIQGFLGGKDFVFGNDANTIVFRTRMAASIFTLLLAILVFLAARELFGTGAGFIALALLVFDPNLLAHGAVVTTDVAVSCFIFATVYAFYRYVKVPSLARLLVVGLAMGLALSSKHTGLLVVPIIVLLAVFELLRSRHEDSPFRTHAARMAVSLLIVGAISIGVLWSVYGFRYQARPDGLKLNPPMLEMAGRVGHPVEAKLLSTVANWKLLPESYLYGLADVRIMGDFYQSYLFGKVYPHGVWFYFPAAFAIKSTLSFLVLLLMAALAISTRKMRCCRQIVFLIVPPAVYLFVAMNSRMNIGVRHILPLYVFLTLLCAGAAWTLIKQDRRWAYGVAALVLLQALSSARTFPAYVAYANELWGGPSKTHLYLTDSNVDWAQQLKATKRYLDERGIKHCWFAYFAQGVVDTSYYGIPCKPLPTPASLWVDEKISPPAAVDGPVLISAGILSGFEFGPGALNPYEQFRQLKPSNVIEYGVFVFDGHFDIPAAAAIGHAQRASALLGNKQPEEALLEAQRAVELAPGMVNPHVVLGDVLTELHRPSEARAAFQKALILAKSVEPEFQRGWISGLEQKLAKKQ